MQQALSSQLAFTVAMSNVGGGGFMGAFGIAGLSGVLATLAVPSAPQPEPFLIQVLTPDRLPVTDDKNFQIS